MSGREAELLDGVIQIYRHLLVIMWSQWEMSGQWRCGHGIPGIDDPCRHMDLLALCPVCLHGQNNPKNCPVKTLIRSK